jgi:hypothetical protein
MRAVQDSNSPQEQVESQPEEQPAPVFVQKGSCFDCAFYEDCPRMRGFDGCRNLPETGLS